MSWKSWEKTAEKGPYSVAIRALLFIFVISLLIGGVATTCHFVMKPAQVLNRVTDPDRMIYTYEWFHSTHGQIKAAADQIAIKKKHIGTFKNDLGPRKDWDMDDKQEHNRLITELNGLEAHRADIVREYNARSGMVTREFLKSKNLPEKIQE